MPETENNELGQIAFETSGDWRAWELGEILDDLDASYRLLIIARYLSRNAKEETRQEMHRQEKLWRRVEMYEFPKIGRKRISHSEKPGQDVGDVFTQQHVTFRMGFEDCFDFWKRYRRRGASLPVHLWMGSRSTPEELQAEIVQLFSHAEKMFPAGHDLRIHRIEMASPGGFSLKGLGEPIQQLRELIKDLCYRNRQERDQGDLQILKGKLAIMTKHALTPQQITFLAIKISENQERVIESIQSGKLALEGEERCEGASTVEPRRRKTRTNAVSDRNPRTL